jgi:SAM-dependent methyltransferase
LLAPQQCLEFANKSEKIEGSDMSSPILHEWERAEIERSAAEASHANVANLLADETQVRRYLDPPADTCYPLEYSYHLLGDVRGKTVLEYGCGDGLNTMVLARRGARVKALDISPDLIEIARQRLIVNQIAGDVEFIVGSAHDLPLPDDSVDVVFGMAILHHLDLALSAREVKRVLRPGGRAIFNEPVRNSKLITALRNLIPYKAPDVSPFERPLTDTELVNYGQGFASYRSRPFTLPTTNLINVLPPLQRRFVHSFNRWDAVILQKLPMLAYYATGRVVELVK